MAIKWLFFCRNKRWTDSVTGEVFEPQSLILFDDAGPLWPIAERALGATMDGDRVAIVAGSGVDFDPASAGPLAGVTSITGAAVQSSFDDATAGRLLLAGAYGWGSSGSGSAGGALWPTGDLNSADVPSGLYTQNGAANGPTGSSTAMIILHRQRGGAGVQLAMGDGGFSGRMWIRGRNGSAWGPWRPVTGERSSNANGEYVRFADGTQICTHQINLGPLDTGAGTFADPYTHSAGVNWEFPASFISAPRGYVQPSVDGGGGSVNARFLIGTHLNITGARMAAIRTQRANSNNNSTDILVDLIAIGRWF